MRKRSGGLTLAELRLLRRLADCPRGAIVVTEHLFELARLDLILGRFDVTGYWSTVEDSSVTDSGRRVLAEVEALI